jgi:citrate lyase subunit beta/citryl-CoA lyase
MDTSYWEEDLRTIAVAGIDGLVIPKAEHGYDIKNVSDILDSIPEARDIFLIPLVESALGVENVYEIAASSARIRGIFFGAEDYTADIGAVRTKEGAEILWARGRIVNGAVAAGVEAIDTPFTDVEDLEGLKKDTLFAKALGFDGKASISPRHCGFIKEIFCPNDEEIRYASRVIDTVKEAGKAGKGVASMDGKMIDKPIVLRALKVLRAAGIKEDFRYE